MAESVTATVMLRARASENPRAEFDGLRPIIVPGTSVAESRYSRLPAPRDDLGNGCVHSEYRAVTASGLHRRMYSGGTAAETIRD